MISMLTLATHSVQRRQKPRERSGAKCRNDASRRPRCIKTLAGFPLLRVPWRDKSKFTFSIPQYQKLINPYRAMASIVQTASSAPRSSRKWLTNFHPTTLKPSHILTTAPCLRPHPPTSPGRGAKSSQTRLSASRPTAQATRSQAIGLCFCMRGN
jgi:hypothetical protein